MKLSSMGQLLAADAPIVQLMEDLGEALNENPNSCFLGGGNPARVPAAEAIFDKHLAYVTQAPTHSHLGIYQSPQGNADVLASVSDYLNSSCGWDVGPENIALVSGSQTAFFILFNLFCDSKNKALLPLVPEYLGYCTQALAPDVFVPHRPVVEQTAEHRFKYRVDFKTLKVHESINMMCVSRPSNPSGNVLTDDEVTRLAALAKTHSVPLILDYAYGLPFPGLVYGQATPYWDEQTIAVLSLSKLGLPGVRSAVIVATPEIIHWVARANTIISLAGGNLGPNLLKSLIESGDMAVLSNNVLPTYYRKNRDILLTLLNQYLAPWRYAVHEPEGAFFIWLWLKELPFGATELYRRLKAKGVIVMPGETFFFGEQNNWDHAKQCVRLTYCQEPKILERAVKTLAQELGRL